MWDAPKRVWRWLRSLIITARASTWLLGQLVGDPDPCLYVHCTLGISAEPRLDVEGPKMHVALGYELNCKGQGLYIAIWQCSW